VKLFTCDQELTAVGTFPKTERPAVAQKPATEIPHFAHITKQAGLTVSHNSSAEKKYIIESVSGGVGFIDCDNDGKLDIITVNG
jgi:hypothetical protein